MLLLGSLGMHRLDITFSMMALCLSVEGVDEAPEHALALVGELCSIGHDGLVDAGDGLVPEDAVVGFVGTGGAPWGLARNDRFQMGTVSRAHLESNPCTHARRLAHNPNRGKSSVRCFSLAAISLGYLSI